VSFAQQGPPSDAGSDVRPLAIGRVRGGLNSDLITHAEHIAEAVSDLHVQRRISSTERVYLLDLLRSPVRQQSTHKSRNAAVLDPADRAQAEAVLQAAYLSFIETANEGMALYPLLSCKPCVCRLTDVSLTSL